MGSRFFRIYSFKTTLTMNHRKGNFLGSEFPPIMYVNLYTDVFLKPDI